MFTVDVVVVIYNYLYNRCLSVVSSNPVHAESYSIQHYVILYNYSLLLRSIRVVMDLQNDIDRSL
jgi:hypothetical protein